MYSMEIFFKKFIYLIFSLSTTPVSIKIEEDADAGVVLSENVR